MRARRVPPALLGLMLLTLLGGVAEARKPVLEDTFGGDNVAVQVRGGRIEATPYGKGWASPAAGDERSPAGGNYIAYDAARLNPEKGTIAFYLKKNNKDPFEAAFSLADNNFAPILVGRFNWGDDPPDLSFATNDARQNVWMMKRSWENVPAYRNVVSPEIRLPGIAPGQWVHFAFTWGPQPGDHAIYMDGKRLDVVMRGPSSIPDLIRKSRYLVFGGRLTANGGATYSMTTSTLAQIRVYDAPINPFGLPGGQAVITSVTDDSFRLPGISGRLVAGDTVTVTLLATPGGRASFDMGVAKGIEMAEVPPTAGGAGVPAVDNGTYRGTYTIKPGDDYEEGYILGRFVSADNVAAEPVASASKWTIDTRPVVTFNIDKKALPADSSAKARVKLVVKDANGLPVKGRRVKLTLATTNEYTGMVGAGDFNQEVGASVESRWRGETDSWGEVEFDYRAGFAAKTAILTAKDLDSGGVAVDYVTSFKEASIDIALTAPISRAAARRGVQYIMKVEATRTELTADGRSRSVIRATLTDPNGVPAAGENVTFALSGTNGTLRVVSGTTNASGVATAEYIAGKKIGIVVVTAAAPFRNASGNVSIVLLADAPAKIYLKARPESLPADGFSRSDIGVKVTDINDNPNKDTRVEFRIAKGGGNLDYADRTTDKDGDAANRYTAGTVPGIASIFATVHSKVPTEAELTRARNVLFATYSPDGTEIRVERWLKKPGDTALKGEPIAEYTIGRGGAVRVLAAPYDCRIEFQYVEYWDTAEIGDTLAEISPAASPKSTGQPLILPAHGRTPRRR